MIKNYPNLDDEGNRQKEVQNQAVNLNTIICLEYAKISIRGIK